jgi:hypothetical protein
MDQGSLLEDVDQDNSLIQVVALLEQLDDQRAITGPLITFLTRLSALATEDLVPPGALEEVVPHQPSSPNIYASDSPRL